MNLQEKIKTFIWENADEIAEKGHNNCNGTIEYVCIDENKKLYSVFETPSTIIPDVVIYQERGGENEYPHDCEDCPYKDDEDEILQCEIESLADWIREDCQRIAEDCILSNEEEILSEIFEHKEASDD